MAKRKRSRYPEGVSEIKDFRKDHQIRIVRSGNITYKSTEGYKNKSDMRTTALNDAIALLSFYGEHITGNQKQDIYEIFESE
jgi:hypothetical protein